MGNLCGELRLKMAGQRATEKELDDMTECSICTEVFTDPRVLPCIHTFCLKCLLNYGKDRPPGDDMPCPLCRKEFTIPNDGLSGMQKNFFMEKLLHARKLSTGHETHHIPCDVCSSEGSYQLGNLVTFYHTGNESVKPASMYCVQCGQNYCDQCSQYHRKMKSSSSHTQVDIGKESKSAEMASKLSANICDQHKGKEIELFCRKCNVAVCMMCVITAHRTHDCLDIETVSRDLRKLVLSDSSKISELWRNTDEVLQRLEKEKNELIRRFAGVADEINTAADKLIAAVENDRQKLLAEVESIRTKQIKQLETAKQEVERHKTALESFRQYSETMLSSGTACDVTRSANSLHDSAAELMMYDIVNKVDSFLPPLSVTFTLTTLLDRDDRSLVGTVTEEGQLMLIFSFQVKYA